MTTQYVDPLDAATAAGERANAYFGKINVSAQFVALIKGQGKVAWGEHMGPDQRRTEVFLHLNPLDAMGLTRPVERNVIAESREWSGIVWASLRDLGVKNVRELHGKFVRAELVKTGRTYTGKDGQTVENTTFKFTAIYPSEKECLAAFETEGSAAAHSQQAAANGSNGAAVNGNGAAPTNGNGAVDEMERMTALQFLPALVAQAAGDKGKLASIIAGMPMIAKYFTIDSPEVVGLMGGK